LGPALSVKDIMPITDNLDAQACLDLDRQDRCGLPEVIWAANKTYDQCLAIARRLLSAGQDAVLTRVPDTFAENLSAELGAEHHKLARLVMKKICPPRPRLGQAGVVCAGTSDLPVADEIALVADWLGADVVRITDVGVAGIHRLLNRADELSVCDVLAVVAGMEGALPSVVAGLVAAPVIAVPTSVGYGASLGGVSALLTMINTCVPGIAVVNIDNGFGAAVMIAKILGLGRINATPRARNS